MMHEFTSKDGNDNATLEKAVSFTAYYAHYYDLPSYESNSFNDFYL